MIRRFRHLWSQNLTFRLAIGVCLYFLWNEYRFLDYDHVRVDAIRAAHIGPWMQPRH